MDSAISTAARALALGDPLTALKHVALRADPAALALRGIAMAQLGELSAAKRLLERAIRGLGESEPVARARCIVAQAEVALALRDLAGAERGLDRAARLLRSHGDASNATFARLLQVRRHALLGEVERAEQELSRLTAHDTPPRLASLLALASADLALKRARADEAARALDAAQAAAEQARLLPVLAEIEQARRLLRSPVARARSQGAERPVLLAELAPLWRSGALVVDACRREARLLQAMVPLSTRPVLFALLLALAEAAPADAAREVLCERVFGVRRMNESHRVRLRVEVGRLRRQLAGLADVRSTGAGFQLLPRAGASCCVLLPAADGEASQVLAMLRGGEAWATSALALALGKSQRAVQRALSDLQREGRVRSVGTGRARRWIGAEGGLATSLLLVAPSALG